MAKGQEQQSADSHVSGQANNQKLSQPAHSLKWKDVATELGTDIDDGLTADDASQRLEEFGRNELGDGQKVNPGKILVRQVANAMTLVLILAMVVSFAIQSWIEGGVVSSYLVQSHRISANIRRRWLVSSSSTLQWASGRNSKLRRPWTHSGP